MGANNPSVLISSGQVVGPVCLAASQRFNISAKVRYGPDAARCTNGCFGEAVPQRIFHLPTAALGRKQHHAQWAVNGPSLQSQTNLAEKMEADVQFLRIPGSALHRRMTVPSPYFELTFLLRAQQKVTGVVLFRSL
ncbi:hypothetical protein [Cognatishimia sp.]|uniref:hypothetical protein n=1 Tax=Cognatishimia sp. TaxID=2211648 RepID=UPI0035124FBB